MSLVPMRNIAIKLDFDLEKVDTHIYLHATS